MFSLARVLNKRVVVRADTTAQTSSEQSEIETIPDTATTGPVVVDVEYDAKPEKLPDGVTYALYAMGGVGIVLVLLSGMTIYGGLQTMRIAFTKKKVADLNTFQGVSVVLFGMGLLSTAAEVAVAKKQES